MLLSIYKMKSLCLTKYDTFKMYPLLDEAPHYEDVLGVEV